MSGPSGERRVGVIAPSPQFSSHADIRVEPSSIGKAATKLPVPGESAA